MRIVTLVASVMLLPFIWACEIGTDSGAGLRLPNGDVVAGRLAFSELGCVACHTIADEPEEVDRPRTGPVVVLGGRVPHIATHGELVTSIVNPSHDISRRYPRESVTVNGKSMMGDFNERMTVKQLIDLTSYLQSKYRLDVNKVYDSSS